MPTIETGDTTTFHGFEKIQAISGDQVETYNLNTHVLYCYTYEPFSAKIRRILMPVTRWYLISRLKVKSFYLKHLSTPAV